MMIPCGGMYLDGLYISILGRTFGSEYKSFSKKKAQEEEFYRDITKISINSKMCTTISQLSKSIIYIHISAQILGSGFLFVCFLLSYFF